MTLLSKLNDNLALQMTNIMSDNPSIDELKAINEQTKQLIGISKQITDNHRLLLDAARLNYEMGNKTDLTGTFIDVTPKQVGNG